MGGGRRPEGELLVSDAGRRLKEGAGTLRAAVIRATLAAGASRHWSSEPLLSFQAAFRLSKSKKTLDGFVLSATDLKRQMTQPTVSSREAGRGNISIHGRDK